MHKSHIESIGIRPVDSFSNHYGGSAALVSINGGRYDPHPRQVVQASADVGTRSKFNALAKIWEEETGYFSSTTQKFLHPAYQQIIGMGQTVIPYIIEELKIHPGHWFWALRYISGKPNFATGIGVKEAVEAWTEWWKDCQRYYEGTWAGCMVPTDEVIAHLMLMRGAEHEFWKQANQHAPWRPEAGI